MFLYLYVFPLKLAALIWSPVLRGPYRPQAPK